MNTAAAPVSHRTIWALAAPIILSNLTIPLLGAVDTAVMGHLPHPEFLGAVGLGGMIFSFIFWGFGFLRMGTTGLVAQAYGADEGREIRRILAQSVLLALALAAAVLILQRPVWWLAERLIDTTPQITALTETYFNIRIWAAPASLLNYTALGWLIGMQDTRSALLLMVVVNGVNIVLDVVLVVGLGMTIDGVALASVCAEWSGVLAAAAIVVRRLPQGQWRWSEVADWASLRRLLDLNRDIMLRTLCLIFAFAFFTRQSAALGPLILAANTVLLNFLTVMAYGLDGFANAAEALIGRFQAAGRHRQPNPSLRRAFLLTGVWSGLCAALAALVFLLAGTSLIALLTDLPEVRETARRYLPWLVAAPVLSVWCYWLDGVFIGATYGQRMRNSMLLSLFGVFLPVWWFSQILGNHGLWLALMSFMVARGLTLYWLLQRSALGQELALVGDRP